MYCVCKLNSCARGVSVVGTQKKADGVKIIYFCSFFFVCLLLTKKLGFTVRVCRLHSCARRVSISGTQKKADVRVKRIYFCSFFLKKGGK